MFPNVGAEVSILSSSKLTPRGTRSCAIGVSVLSPPLPPPQLRRNGFPSTATQRPLATSDPCAFRGPSLNNLQQRHEFPDTGTRNPYSSLLLFRPSVRTTTLSSSLVTLCQEARLVRPIHHQDNERKPNQFEHSLPTHCACASILRSCRSHEHGRAWLLRRPNQGHGRKQAMSAWESGAPPWPAARSCERHLKVPPPTPRLLPMGLSAG